jgi:diguanylate cyclase (GGDEF)-like protein
MSAMATQKVRILVADDEPDLLTVMRETLESQGFLVDTAADGAEALEAIRKSPPDIAVLDLKMPHMDGFQVCEALREDPLYEHLPVIILSASGNRVSKIQGLNLGADDFITKPVDILELLARIKMILRRNRSGLDASPLTHLPGNVSIETRVEQALTKSAPLAVLYIDLNQFKAFNDAYGYDAGDHVLKATAQLLTSIARPHGEFVGHIGGDDFIVLTTPERMEELAKEIVAEFDKIAPGFYNEEDRKRGKITSKDRQGNVKEFPFVSAAIGICHNQQRRLLTYAQISQLGAELKKFAKQKAGSAYVIDRRKD